MAKENRLNPPEQKGGLWDLFPDKNIHTCRECYYFSDDDGSVKFDRFSDETYTFCMEAGEYTSEDDSTCDWFVMREK